MKSFFTTKAQRHEEEQKQKTGKSKALIKNVFPLCLCVFAVKIPELKVQGTALYRTRNYRINKNSGLFLSLSQVAVIDQFVQPA